jgi:hypothetical protein
MQIHEITLARVDEGVLSTIGQDIKSAVTEPFQKFQAAASEPDGLSSAGGYATAMDKYYRGQIEKQQPAIDQQQAQRLAAQTQQKAKELAQQWTQYLKSKKPVGKLPKSSPTPLTPTGQYAKKPTGTTTIDAQTGRPVDQLAPVKEQVGGPTPTELARYQQKLAAASQTKSGFDALPGETPPPGGKVRSAVTTAPKNVLTGSRAQEFRDWANKQLASRVTGTNQTLTLDQVRKADPAVAQQLAQLLPAILMKNDTQAMEQYFTIAMQAMQKLAAATRKTNQSKYATAGGGGGEFNLEAIISKPEIEQIKQYSQNPAIARSIKKQFGLR